MKRQGAACDTPLPRETREKGMRMKQSFKKRIKDSLPPIANRDAKIAMQWERIKNLRHENETLAANIRENQKSLDLLSRKIIKTELDLETARRRPKPRSSFEQKVSDLRRTTLALRRIDIAKEHPINETQFKLRNYSVAQSHGIKVPKVLNLWMRAEEIRVEALPDAFVLKADRGADEYEALALKSVAPDEYHRINSADIFSLEDIRQYFGTRARSVGPFFAEEVPSRHSQLRFSTRIDVFAFYGQIGYIQLARHSGSKEPMYRFLSREGTSLNSEMTDTQIDSEIPLPRKIDQILNIAEHASKMVGLPFVRIGIYETETDILLGEITANPRIEQKHGLELDRHLGEIYENAQLRLEMDIIHGRPFGVLQGTQAFETFYPKDTESNLPLPGRIPVPCSAWCSDAAKR